MVNLEKNLPNRSNVHHLIEADEQRFQHDREVFARLEGDKRQYTILNRIGHNDLDALARFFRATDFTSLDMSGDYV